MQNFENLIDFAQIGKNRQIFRWKNAIVRYLSSVTVYATMRENGFNPMTKCTNEIVRLSNNVIQ